MNNYGPNSSLHGGSHIVAQQVTEFSVQYSGSPRQLSQRASRISDESSCCMEAFIDTLPTNSANYFYYSCKQSMCHAGLKPNGRGGFYCPKTAHSSKTYARYDQGQIQYKVEITFRDQKRIGATTVFDMPDSAVCFRSGGQKIFRREPAALKTLAVLWPTVFKDIIRGVLGAHYRLSLTRSSEGTWIVEDAARI